MGDVPLLTTCETSKREKAYPHFQCMDLVTAAMQPRRSALQYRQIGAVLDNMVIPQTIEILRRQHLLGRSPQVHTRAPAPIQVRQSVTLYTFGILLQRAAQPFNHVSSGQSLGNPNRKVRKPTQLRRVDRNPSPFPALIDTFSPQPCSRVMAMCRVTSPPGAVAVSEVRDHHCLSSRRCTWCGGSILCGAAILRTAEVLAASTI
jgi:hypothetical protein